VFITTGLQLVALLTIGNSWYVRSAKSRCCESNLVISPEYQGRGLGRELINVEQSIEIELDFTSMINDYSASNERMRRLLRRIYGSQLTVIGCLQRGLYTAEFGWDDQIITYRPISSRDIRTFTEIAECSRMREVIASKL